MGCALLVASNLCDTTIAQLRLFDPVISVHIAYLGQCILLNLIKSFDHSIFLRMIGCRFLMLDMEFCIQFNNQFIYKMSTLVANKDLGETKPCFHIIKKETLSQLLRCNISQVSLLPILSSNL